MLERYLDECIEADARAERTTLATKAPEMRFHYDPKWLQLADRIERATNAPILNPRDLSISDIEHVDIDWIEDRATWIAAKRYKQHAALRASLFGTIDETKIGLRKERRDGG